MKFIANSDEAVLQKNLSRIMYDKRGNETNEESLAVSQCLCEILPDGSETKTYYIFTLNGNLYNPIGVDSSQKRRTTMSLKKVDQQTFDYYMMYIQTNNSLYLTRAQRRFIND